MNTVGRITKCLTWRQLGLVKATDERMTVLAITIFIATSVPLRTFSLPNLDGYGSVCNHMHTFSSLLANRNVCNTHPLCILGLLWDPVCVWQTVHWTKQDMNTCSRVSSCYSWWHPLPTWCRVHTRKVWASPKHTMYRQE